jgi:hypothetical protein
MTLVIWSLSIATMRDKESYFREWALNYLGAARTAVSSNMSRAASRSTRSSEGEPSRALRHSSQPLSDNDKNILRVICCGQTVIQQHLNTAQIGTVYMYIIWIKDKILGLFFIPFINRLVRFGTFSYRGSTSNRIVRGNLVGIRSHIIRSLSHLGH